MALRIPNELTLDDLEINLLRGLNFYDKGNWDKAIPFLTISASMGNLTAVFKLANCFSNMGHEEEAIPLLAAASKCGHAGASNNLATLLATSGDSAGAKELYLKAAESGEFKAMFNYAVQLDPELNVVEYQHWLKKAADAGHLRSLALLGVSIYQSGNTAEGLKILKDAMDKGSLSAYLSAIDIAWEKSEYQQAITLAHAAKELPLNPDDSHLVPNLDYALCLNHFELRNKSDALRYYHLALAQGFEVSWPTLEAIEKLETSIMNRGCPNCGEGNALEANYCAECGAKLDNLESHFSSSTFENLARIARADSWCLDWFENRLTGEALLSNLTNFIRKFDLDGTPGYLFQGLRVILKYSNDTLLWATPDDGWFMSHQTLEVSASMQELLTGNRDLPKFDWSVEANGFMIPDQLIPDTISQLSITFGAPNLLLPFSILESEDEEDFVANWELDEETEVDEDILEAINKYIEIDFLKRGDLGKITYPWSVQVVDAASEWPTYSYPAKFKSFLDDLRLKPDWVVVLNECCRGCAEATEQNIRLDPIHDRSEIFFTWEQTLGVCPSGKIFQGHTSQSREAIDFLAELATKYSLPTRVGERPEDTVWRIDIGNF